MRNVTTPLLVRAEFEGLLRRKRLRFPDPLEQQFRDSYFERWVGTNRAAFVGGLFVLAGFGLVDRWAAPLSLRAVWLLRFGIGCPAIALLLLLSFTPLYRRIMQPSSALVVALVGVLITLMELAMGTGEPGYNLYMFGIVLVVFFGCAAPRLRFWYAMAAGWPGVLSSWWIGFDHSVWQQSQTTVHFVVLEAFLVGSSVIGTFASYLLESGARRNFLQQLVIEQEQERSEALLLNVLPALIADRLKGGKEVVDAFDEVSVLFADIVDFTPFSATLSPQELVTFLNNVFLRFDALVDRLELEKIKTMGDAYMVVGGVPTPRADHAERIAEMALNMQEEVRRLSEELGWSIRLRIGLNTGPVVAGIIGRRKFSYDLWGDTVNTASRMEAVAFPETIQVTEAVYERLKARYQFEGPTAVLVKGKGELLTYRLAGRRTDFAPEVVELVAEKLEVSAWFVGFNSECSKNRR